MERKSPEGKFRSMKYRNSEGETLEEVIPDTLKSRQKRWGKKEDREAFEILNRLLKDYNLSIDEFFKQVGFY